MEYRAKIQMDLIKLINGDRLLRLSYAPLDLVLEKKLNSELTVFQQKERLFGVFEAALTKAELTPAWLLADGIAETRKGNEAYERVLKSDVKYRFVIDMKSLA